MKKNRDDARQTTSETKRLTQLSATRSPAEEAPLQVGQMVKARRTQADDTSGQVGQMVKARRTQADDNPSQVGQMVKARKSAGDESVESPRKSHAGGKDARPSPRRKEDI